MQENRLVSIIIPTYNVEKYVMHCLKSVQAQTYRNIEIIIVDDGSTDNTYRLCCEMAQLDNRLKVYSLEVNQGVSGARNFGLQKIQGEFICFVDGDDWIEDRLIEYTLSKFIKGIDIVYYGFNVTGKYVEKVYTREEAAIDFLNLKMLGGYCCDKMFRYSCVKDLEFPEDMKIGEDGVFTFEAILNANHIYYTSMPFYHYEKRDDSSSSRAEFTLKHFDCFLQTQKIFKLINKNNVSLLKYYPCFCITLNFSLLVRMVQEDAISRYTDQYQILMNEIRFYCKDAFLRTTKITLKVKCCILWLYYKRPESMKYIIMKWKHK